MSLVAINNNNIYLTAIGLSPGGSGIRDLLEEFGKGWQESRVTSGSCSLVGKQECAHLNSSTA